MCLKKATHPSLFPVIPLLFLSSRRRPGSSAQHSLSRFLLGRRAPCPSPSANLTVFQLLALSLKAY